MITYTERHGMRLAVVGTAAHHRGRFGLAICYFVMATDYARTGASVFASRPVDVLVDASMACCVSSLV